MLSGIFYAFLHFVPPKSVNLGGLFAINMEVMVWTVTSRSWSIRLAVSFWAAATPTVV